MSKMDGGFGMSPRKAMAGGADSGNFGVESYASQHGASETHPDMTAKTGHKGPMADGERGIGESVMHTKGHLPAQAHPDHGPTHPGGHRSGHYATKL